MSDPPTAEVWARRAQAALDLQRNDRAVDCALEALALEPMHGDAALTLASAYLNMARVHDAVDAARRAVTLTPESPHAWHILGLAAFYAGAYDVARDALPRAVEILPTHGVYQAGLALVLGLDGRVPALRACVDEALRAAPEDVWVLDTVVEALCKAKQFDRAVEVSERLCALDPSHHGSHLRRAQACFGAWRLDEAEESARTALSMHPAHADTWRRLGLILVRRGRRDEGIAAIERALDLAPDMPGLRRRLEEIRAAKE